MLKSGFWRLAAPCLLIIAAALATVSIASDSIGERVLGQANFIIQRGQLSRRAQT